MTLFAGWGQMSPEQRAAVQMPNGMPAVPPGASLGGFGGQSADPQPPPFTFGLPPGLFGGGFPMPQMPQGVPEHVGGMRFQGPANTSPPPPPRPYDQAMDALSYEDMVARMSPDAGRQQGLLQQLFDTGGDRATVWNQFQQQGAPQQSAPPSAPVVPPPGLQRGESQHPQTGPAPDFRGRASPMDELVRRRQAEFNAQRDRALAGTRRWRR